MDLKNNNLNYLIDNLNIINNDIEIIRSDYNLSNKATLIIVTKNIEIDKIEFLIKKGCKNFAENKIQEAISKYEIIKKKYPHIKLFFIGHLQSNKVKYAIKLCDYIMSVDSYKLIDILHKESIKNNIFPKIFLQINITNESQKYGIKSDELDEFIQYIDNYRNNNPEFKLDIIGLMAIGKKNINNNNILDENIKYYSIMKNLQLKYNFKYLSTGMSSDYKLALKLGSNFIRVGSNIFTNKLKNKINLK